MSKFTVTADNYHSTEANKLYFSASQIKDFISCPAMAMAKINGEYEPPKTDALLIGSYIDAYFTDDLQQFKDENPEIFSSKGATKGELKSPYKHADVIIQKIEEQPMMVRYLQGAHQVIKVGTVLGQPFKIKMDSYFENKVIVDLKIMKSFDKVWVEGMGKLPFPEAWGYTISGAIYQAVEGNLLPFYLVAATKESEPNKGIFAIPQDQIDLELEILATKIDEYADIKSGKIEARRCERCDWCKQTKIIDKIIDYHELDGDQT